MTPEERQALREKHQPQPHTEWFPVCAACNTQSPCDVIKVLDATEPEMPINWAAGK
jgi:carbonic anhydrase